LTNDKLFLQSEINKCTKSLLVQTSRLEQSERLTSRVKKYKLQNELSAQKNKKDMNPKMMQEAINMALEGMRSGKGGPFGAVVVKNGEIVGRGCNMVTSTNDPTAHAEVTAIRDACKNLGSFQLDDCEIYTSCEPCPMCLGAIYWARPKNIYFACTKKDAAEIGFDDAFIYEEIERPHDKRSISTEQFLRDEAIKVFQEWDEKQDRTDY
jgi:guanine deaminase